MTSFRDLVDPLSPRELQTLWCITNGMTNTEIVELMNVSMNSVKSYIRGAYRKIDVSRRVDAVIWGVQNGLLDDDPV